MGMTLMGRALAPVGFHRYAVRMNPPTGHILDWLHAHRHLFGEGLGRQKAEALHALAARSIRAPDRLRKLHATLCYLVAYPDDVEVFHLAGTMLAHFGDRIAALGDRARNALEGSGIEGTEIRLEFSFPEADRLVRRCGRDLDIDWENYEAPEELDTLLVHCISPAETQTFDDGEISTRDWVRDAVGPFAGTDLQWLWNQIERRIRPRSLREALYEKACVPLVWRLRGTGASKTANRLNVRKPFVHGDAGIVRWGGEIGRAVTRPLGRIRAVSRSRGRTLSQIALDALAARCREVYATSHGSPDEVYEVDVGRGLRVVVIGILPEHRMSLESTYGYLLLKNGIPVAYGGISVLFRQGNTGINVFEEFRRGEAAYFFVQTLRVFHALFGCTRFVLNAYQAGGGNPEAIDSGAFWFYYKLGFRPAEPSVRKRAEREWTKLRQGRQRRTSREALRILGRADLELTLPGATPEQRFNEHWLGVLAAGATRAIANEGCADRARGLNRLVARVARDLGVRGANRWPAAERRAFEGLVPIAALIDGLAGWTPADKQALVRLARSKGARHERVYASALRDNDRFRRALARYCRRGV